MRLPLLALVFFAGCYDFDAALEDCRAQGRCEGAACGADGACPGSLTCVDAVCRQADGGSATGGGTATGGGLATGGGTEEDAGTDAGTDDAGIDAGPRCNTTTCANGCCTADGTCITRNSSAACGRLGSSCEACSTGETCTIGVCTECKGCIEGERCRGGDVSAACGVQGAACTGCQTDAGAVCLGNACRTCNSTMVVGQRWAEQNLLSPSPPGLWGHGMAGLECRAVLFGGSTRAGTPAIPAPVGQTWVWNGGGWVRDGHETEPTARYETAMAPIGGSAILFGGHDASAVMGDTWRYTPGEGWVQLTIAGPSARFGHVMAFDKSTNTIVLFGGTNAAGMTMGDTWSFDGSTWSQSMTGASNVPNSSGAAMGAERGGLTNTALVLLVSSVGPNGSSMWTLPGGGTLPWQSSFNLGTAPPVATRGAMAPHGLTNVLTYVPGSPLSSDYWTFSEGRLNFWNNFSNGPPPRFGHAMVTTDTGLLLVGGQNGSTVFKETWKQ